MSFRSFSSKATRCSSSFSWLVNVITFSSFSSVAVLLKREKNVKVQKYCMFVFIISVYVSESTLLNDNCVMEVIMTDRSAMLIMLTEWTLMTRLKIIKRIKFMFYTIFNVVTGTQQCNIS